MPRYGSTYLTRTAIGSFCLAALICASDANAGEVTADKGDSSEPAETPASSSDSGEIIVTAQRRAENMQKVPISIQAFNEVKLMSAAAKGVEDLPLLTPGLTMQRNSGGSVPFIRGVGSPAANAGNEAAVATYVDGVYRQGLYTSHLSFADVERVEVLKGPQGTLFGRNTTGGLIHIITKDPAAEPSAKFSLSVGTYETYEINAYGTTGIVDDVAMSVAGYVRRQEKGYGINLLTGNKASFRNESSIHSKIKFDNRSTRITLSGDYSYVEDPRGFTREAPPGAIGGVANGLPAQQSTFNGDYHDIQHNKDVFSNSDSYGGSLTIDQDIGSLNAVSITAWRNDWTDIGQDNDFGRADLSYADINFYTRNFTQEFRISSPGDNSISWIAGLFYLNGSAGNRLDIFSGPVNIVARYRGRVKTKSYSAFAEVGIKMFDDAGKLTLGGRYTIDKRRISGTVNGAAVPPPTVNPEAEWKDPTYRAVYSHQFTPEVMAYASYNRGFKSGNYNIIPATTAAYRPEFMDAYEVGIKSQLFDRRVRFNLSAFHYDYRDLQLTISSATVVTTINAADARIRGVEGELSATLAPGLTIDLGASYVDGKYLNFKNAEVYLPNVDAAGQPIGGNSRGVNFDASGQRLIRTPDFTASAGLTYTAPVGNGEITATARAAYTGSVIWEPAGRIRQDAYTLLNASIGYKSDEGWGIRLLGNNITDAKYSIYSGATALSDFFAAGDPATFAIAFDFSF